MHSSPGGAGNSPSAFQPPSQQTNRCTMSRFLQAQKNCEAAGQGACGKFRAQGICRKSSRLHKKRPSSLSAIQMTGCIRRAPSSPRQGLMMHFMNIRPTACGQAGTSFLFQELEGFRFFLKKALTFELKTGGTYVYF
jgi:hypothetical protein